MVYVDVCQICGVAFNISRMRRRDEPRSACWDASAISFSDDVQGSYIEDSDPYAFLACASGSGCMLNWREPAGDVMRSPWKMYTIGLNGEKLIDPTAPASLKDIKGYVSVGRHLISAYWFEEAELLSPEFFARDNGAEHIAGPGCKSDAAYGGHRITYEEMMGCRTVQCLVNKRQPFMPQADDEDFELRGTFFLSGLGDGMLDMEMNGDMDTFPAHRHSAEVHPSNFNLDRRCAGRIERASTSTDMPFHPWCLEVYKRVALRERACIDLAGLYDWYLETDDTGGIWYSPRSHDVDRLSVEVWRHEAGTDFLAANPLFVPGLGDLVQSCISMDPAFSTSIGAFDLSEEKTVSLASNHFAGLPFEIRLMIVSQLPSKSIANLRLACRAFRQLPISLWRTLISRDMPWLWEAWPEEETFPISFWATTTKEQLQADPGMSKSPRPIPNRIRTKQIDWFQLYVALKRDLPRWKGLQNRKRIWLDCEQIVRRIQNLREEGQIPGLDTQI